MKKITILIFIILIPYYLNAQPSFININSGPEFYNSPYCIDFSGDRIFATSRGVNPSTGDYSNTLFELNQEGEIVNQATFSNNATHYITFTDILIEGDTLFVFGSGDPWLVATGYCYVFMKKFDLQFNELASFDYRLDPLYYQGILRGNVKTKTDHFIYFASVKRVANTISPFYFEINRSGDLVRKHFDQVSSNHHITFDFAFRNDIEGFYTFVWESQAVNFATYMYKYDLSLNLTDKILLPEHFSLFTDVISLNDSTLALSGTYLEFHQSISIHVGTMKMNTNGNLIDVYLFNPEINPALEDTTCYPAYYHSLDTLPDGNFIMCATNNVNSQYFAQQDPSYINLFKLTPDMNLIWQKYIGGDANYEAYAMKATPDSGIMIAGCYSETPPTNSWKKELLFIKTDRNGNISMANIANENLKVSEAILFPNPARDVITLDFSRVYQEATFQLIDISGKTVLETQLNNNRQQVDISGVPAGTYVYRIFNGEGLDERGKVVVE